MTNITVLGTVFATLTAVRKLLAVAGGRMDRSSNGFETA